MFLVFGFLSVHSAAWQIVGLTFYYGLLLPFMAFRAASGVNGRAPRERWQLIDNPGRPLDWESILKLTFHAPYFFPRDHCSKSVYFIGFQMNSKTLRQANNVWTNKHFAIAIGAIMVLFIVSHWCDVVYLRYGPRKSIPFLRRLIRYCRYVERPSRALWFEMTILTHNRVLRRFLKTAVLGIPFERWLLYSVYWSINLILTLTSLDLHTLSYVRPLPSPLSKAVTVHDF
jgi:hypothetical protein